MKLFMVEYYIVEERVWTYGWNNGKIKSNG